MKRLIAITAALTISTGSAHALQPYPYNDCTEIEKYGASIQCHIENVNTAIENISALQRIVGIDNKYDPAVVAQERKAMKKTTVSTTEGKPLDIVIDNQTGSIDIKAMTDKEAKAMAQEIEKMSKKR